MRFSVCTQRSGLGSRGFSHVDELREELAGLRHWCAEALEALAEIPGFRL